MVEISKSGSGEGLGGVIPRGYSKKTRCAVLAHVVQNKEHLTLGVDRRSCSPSRPRSEVLQSLGDLVLGQKDRFVALPDLQCLGQQRPGAASGCV